MPTEIGCRQIKVKSPRRQMRNQVHIALGTVKNTIWVERMNNVMNLT